ncbi:MAG: hypothetical protein KDD42_07500, partial [Bdellovibrionales bacterium]|nr:hypothetical protein [Bdellovibrionales bacterium]
SCQKPRPNTWLVSFGDLLTLLVCFFIAILSASPMNPANSTSASSVSAQNYDEKVRRWLRSTSRLRSGTTLANYTDETGPNSDLIKLRIDLGNQSFLQNGVTLEPKTRRQLKRVIALQGYELQTAAISSCSTEGGAALEKAWFVSMDRALEVRRQMIDTGVANKRIELEVVGPFCQAGQFDGARVTVVLKEE